MVIIRNMLPDRQQQVLHRMETWVTRNRSSSSGRSTDTFTAFRRTPPASSQKCIDFAGYAA